MSLVTIIVSAFSIDIAKIGAIPRTIGTMQSVNFSNVVSLLWPAVEIALLVAIESLLSARVSQIPMAVVAGLLLGTSYRIFNPTSIIESLRTTKSEAITIIFTAISSVVIDLIWGIAIGITLHVFLEKIKKRTSKA